jgi:predicted XRE-type DNA-binding protein
VSAQSGSRGFSRAIYLATLPEVLLVLKAAARREGIMRMDVEMFDSVFDALADTPAEAANMNARFELLSALKARIRSWELPQEAAAGRLGLTRPRLNGLLKGKLAKFSPDARVNLATASGLTVHVHVAEAA